MGSETDGDSQEGKHPHPDSKESWFWKALKQRVKIEPIIGHLKCDHRMNRCRYKGKAGDTVNVIWATLAGTQKRSPTSPGQREKG